jgi:hypothetical protein
VTPRFVPPDGPSRAIEAQLRALDPFLRAIAGPGATVLRECDGALGRTIERQREDGVTVAVTIGPLLLDPTRGGTRPYLVALSAWADSGGQRHHWRNGPEWTVSLAGDTDIRATERIIAQAWKTAEEVDRAQIVQEGGNEGTIGGK